MNLFSVHNLIEKQCRWILYKQQKINKHTTPAQISLYHPLTLLLLNQIYLVEVRAQVYLNIAISAAHYTGLNVVQ